MSRVRTVINALSVENPLIPRLDEAKVLSACVVAEKRTCERAPTTAKPTIQDVIDIFGGAVTPTDGVAVHL